MTASETPKSAKRLTVKAAEEKLASWKRIFDNYVSQGADSAEAADTVKRVYIWIAEYDLEAAKKLEATRILKLKLKQIAKKQAELKILKDEARAIYESDETFDGLYSKSRDFARKNKYYEIMEAV